MKKMIAALAAVATVSVVSLAHAANWVAIASWSKGPKCKVYNAVDTASWSYSGTVVTAWTKHVYGPSHAACTQADDEEIRYLNQFDCSKRISRGLSYHVTSWSGKTSSGSLSGEWAYIVPDTVGEAEYNFVCSHLPKGQSQQVVSLIRETPF